MNYTKEMQQSNIPPEMGMKFTDINNNLCKCLAVSSYKGVIIVTYTYGAFYKAVKFDSNTFLPIDTRTDTEKAVDDLKDAYMKWMVEVTGSYSGFIVEEIKAGNVRGVKWVGND